LPNSPSYPSYAPILDSIDLWGRAAAAAWERSPSCGSGSRIEM
jgi:hypothetical protein